MGEIGIVAGFTLFMLLFVGAGLLSLRKKHNSRKDYFLAGQNAPPWMVGISAIATNNSGYMFTGMLGYTYIAGLSAVWIALGFVLGDFIASLFVHQRFRRQAGLREAVSYTGLLSSWTGNDARVLRAVASLITLVFLLAYAGAQLSAGNKVLSVIVDWPQNMGALIATAIVMAYCFAGGVRASMWTDVAQGVLMFFTMVLMAVVALDALGGVASATSAARQVPGLLNWHPDSAMTGVLGGLFFAFSWVFAGVTVVGQPHIMSRIMTLDKPGNYQYVRLWYYLWYALFYMVVIVVGLLARLVLPELGAADPEKALPYMAQQWLPGFWVGLVVAGVFAACISTADSQVLTCAATLANDVNRRWFGKPMALRLATTVCMLLALLVVLWENVSVFGLVVFAWSGMGCAFGPLLMVYVSGGRPNETTAVIMMLSGLFTVILWGSLGWGAWVYEGFPGVVVPLLVWLVSRYVRGVPGARDTAEKNA